MDSTERSMEAAIAQIEAFLESAAANTNAITAEDLRRLSRTIASARAARESHHNGQANTQRHTARYRDSLERLRQRLHDIEANLSAERDRLLEEHDRVSRTRAWHSSFSRTQ